MEKKCCQINIFETDAGYRIELRGDKDVLKAAYGGCCDQPSGEGEACCAGPLEIKRDCCKVTLSEVSDGFDVVYEGDKASLHSWLKKAGSACCTNNCCTE